MDTFEAILFEKWKCRDRIAQMLRVCFKAEICVLAKGLVERQCSTSQRDIFIERESVRSARNKVNHGKEQTS